VSEPAVLLRGVSKRFGEHVAVQPLDLEIPEGGFYSIIGPSGCGKTTTLRMVAGLETPDSGTIEVAGADVTRTPAYRRPVNTVFQSYALFPHLDVFENIAFGLREEKRPKDEIARRVGEMVDLVRLTGRERSRPKQLSGGQQQRVALARALVKHPAVLLLDEPLGALDLRLRKQLQSELKDVQRRVGVTFVYVTHDQEEAFSMSDRVAVMNEGVLEQEGPPEDVYRRPATLFVAEFVGMANRLAATVTGPSAAGYTVRLADGTTAEAAGPAGLAGGDAVSLIVRPESVTVGAIGVPAVVRALSYLGPSRSLRVEAETLGPLAVTIPGNAGPVAEGDRVAVSWSAADAWLVRAA
jgi:ABC-type Fe3+/spermidine/putrescine transport system ATPase subunit